MGFIKESESVIKKVRVVKRKASLKYAPIRLFVRDKRALSPVMSHLILIAAVIALGLASLAYARNISSDYQADYHQSINSNINKLKETLAFECVYYSGGTVKAYFMNAGSVTSEVDKVYLSTSSTNVTYTMKYMNGTTAPNHTLSVGGERQIVVTQTLLGGNYTIKVTTQRGSTFAYSFSV